MELNRSSGILLHITSLPSPFGIGDMGPEAYEFIDFMENSGNKYWQILPLNPTNEGYGHSPYSSDSAFAGNLLLISPEILEKEGLVNLQDHELPITKNPCKIDFKAVSKFKYELLNEAYHTFKKKKKDIAGFRNFCKEHAAWLEDYSIYKSLHNKYDTHWIGWPQGLRNRDLLALEKAAIELNNEMEKIKYFQFLFFKQWKNLALYATQNQIKFIGDIPIYINHDSADCWANSEYFKLDKNKKPFKVSGVPPDYYSETGQLWGTPVYNWSRLRENNFDWWIQRIKQNLLLFDVVRLDHFRGFSAYWEVPAKHKTAERGKWIKTPGTAFFKTVRKHFPSMPFIAEDLGSLDANVYKLMKRFNFPGMSVLQFAFGDDRSNPYLPYNHVENSLVYTGTHDNNITRGWFDNLDTSSKNHLDEYFGIKITYENVHKILQRTALSSVAKIAIIPMQDILGLGHEAIMNIPGSTQGNWSWRMEYDEISISRAVELKALNQLYGRYTG